MTSVRSAVAKAAGVGQRCIQSVQRSMTRDTWVCCSMISETSTPQGSRVRRQGRSRRVLRCQFRRSCWAVGTPLAYGTAPRDLLKEGNDDRQNEVAAHEGDRMGEVSEHRGPDVR